MVRGFVSFAVVGVKRFFHKHFSVPHPPVRVEFRINSYQSFYNSLQKNAYLLLVFSPSFPECMITSTHMDSLLKFEYLKNLQNNILFVIIYLHRVILNHYCRVTVDIQSIIVL